MTELWITLGPSSIDIQESLLDAGVSGVRLTFSFGTPQLQLDRAKRLKAVARELGRNCTVVADLEGEKVRLGEFVGEPTFHVTAGDELRIDSLARADIAKDTILPVRSEKFVAGLRVGSRLIIGDGSAILEIIEASVNRTQARAVTTGTINQTRGITVQNSDFTPVSLTEKDRSNLRFVIENPEFDMVALSFVSSAADIKHARSIIQGYDRVVPIVAKVETAEGVDAIEEICGEADLVMAARGDLALMMPWVELPRAVNAIANASVNAGTPWILATQIAEGLERFAFMTRAEICDLSHWLETECAAIMLSYETVFGSNAIGAVVAVKAMIDRWSK